MESTLDSTSREAGPDDGSKSRGVMVCPFGVLGLLVRQYCQRNAEASPVLRAIRLTTNVLHLL